MIDLFAKILSSVVSQAMGGDKTSKLEKDLYRKFDAVEEQARRDSTWRWVTLAIACVILALAAFLSFRLMRHEVKQMVGERLDQEFSSAAIQQSIETSAQKFAEKDMRD